MNTIIVMIITIIIINIFLIRFDDVKEEIAAILLYRMQV